MGLIRIEDFHGLYTWGGIRRRPQGSMFQGTNFIAEAPGVIRSRVGVGRSANGAASSITSVHPTTTATDGTSCLVTCYDNSLRAFDGSGAVSLIQSGFTASSYNVNGGWRVRSGRGLQNLYLSSAYGVKRYDGTNLELAGMPRAQCYRQANFGPPGNQLVAGTGLLAASSSRAYRFTVFRYDANGAEISGPPSGRMAIRNLTGTTGYTGGALDPKPMCLLSNQLGGTTALTASFYIRTWASRTNTGEPDDEMYLLDEHQLTASDIANGYYGFTDTTTDTILTTGARLHTNANDYQPPEPLLAKGIVNEDAHPPRVRDIVSWSNRTWYGGQLNEWQSQTIVLLALPANLDTITVGGKTLTFKTGAVGSNNDVHVESTYLAFSNNIEATAMNLVDQINIQRGTTGVVATYISGPSAFPGQILLEPYDFAGATWAQTTTVSAAAKWKLGPISGYSNATSTFNTLAFSKQGRPDAVAPVNRLTVGADSTLEVWRIVPLRDFLYVFTTQGIYRVSGDSATNYAVTLLDSTAIIIGPQCIAVVDDRLYAWCSQGICAIDATGVEWISQPIEPTLRSIIATISTNPFNMMWQSFAAPWQDKHRVLFWYPSTAFDVVTPLNGLNCTKALVYDTRTREWSHHTNGAGGYCCASDNRIVAPVYGDSVNPDSTGYLWAQNAGAAANDYRDTKRDGSYDNFTTTVGVAIQAPEGVSAPHWQEVSVAIERDLTRSLPPASNIIATFYSADMLTSVQVSAGTSDTPDYRRFIVPQNMRSQPTLIFTIASDPSSAAAAVFLGVECIDILYGDVARGTVRK